MRKRTRIASLVTCSLALGVAMAAPAAAERRFQFPLSNVNSGYLSPPWTDHNTDAVYTEVIFSNCNKSVITIGLYRQIFGPDPNLGNRDVCGGRVASWGDLSAADYRFKIMNQVVGLNANPVTVDY